MKLLVWIAEHAVYISVVAAIIAIPLKFEHWLPKRINKYLLMADIFIVLATLLLGIFKEHLDNKWKSVIQEQSKQHAKQIFQLTSTNKQIKQERDKDKQQISELTVKAKVAEELTYQEYALLSADGYKKGISHWNGIVTNPTPLMGWNKGFVSRQENKLVCVCSDTATQSCRSVIQKFPQYPFSYYFLAICLKETGDSSWKKYANTARSILLKTTRIPNHQNDHDLILVEVNKWFAKSDQ